MKQTLPTLTLLLLLAAVAPAWAQVRNPPATNSQSGEDLVTSAARQLLDEQALECKLRYRVRSGRNDLIGQGAYMQVGPSDAKLLRLELKLQVGEHVASLQQISGEEYLWIRQDLPQGKQGLSRISLRQYREAARNSQTAPIGATTTAWLLMGGLSRLIEAQHMNFEFETPRAGMLQNVPVWVVAGHWRPAQLQNLLNGKDLPLDQLPEQLPARVELTLGRDDILPLFPYRLEWFRQAREESGGKDKAPVAREPRWEPMVTMELYEVSRRAQYDPARFEYDPGDQEVEDVTQAYLNKAGLTIVR
jgi:hypothetical protein